MARVSGKDVQAYIEANYLTLEALARRCGVAPERIIALETAECIPRHSYEVNVETTFISTFGTYALPSDPCHYYHPSVVDWVAKAEALAKTRPLDAVAAEVRKAFEADVTAAVAGRERTASLRPDCLWKYVSDGTWGLCLKELSARFATDKEMARAAIARIVERNPDRRLSDAERAQLQSAVAAYEGAALPFAPHEVDESSRRREIEPALEAFGLRPGPAADRRAV